MKNMLAEADAALSALDTAADVAPAIALAGRAAGDLDSADAALAELTGDTQLVAAGAPARGSANDQYLGRDQDQDQDQDQDRSLDKNRNQDDGTDPQARLGAGDQPSPPQPTPPPQGSPQDTLRDLPLTADVDPAELADDDIDALLAAELAAPANAQPGPSAEAPRPGSIPPPLPPPGTQTWTFTPSGSPGPALPSAPPRAGATIGVEIGQDAEVVTEADAGDALEITDDEWEEL